MTQINDIFMSFQASYHDTSNFDGEFTAETVEFTPCDKQLIMSIDQNEFASFSYINTAYPSTSPRALTIV